MKSRQTDRLISEIAQRQHGVVTRAQLLCAGVLPETVRWRVRAKRLLPLHRGVYRVGPLCAPQAREMAAVLACGAGAVISHGCAAAPWHLGPPPADTAPIDVTVPGVDRGRRPGIRVHRVADLRAEDVTELGCIPITTLHRTVFDLAGEIRPDEMRRIFARAVRAGLGVPHGAAPRPASMAEVENRAGAFRTALIDLIERHPRRRGVPLLRKLLADDTAPGLTRSEAEERVLRLIAKARLPRPEVNAWIERCEVDFLWRPQRVVLEVDGYAFHASRESFESDRSRDARLLAAGFRVMRVTWRQITSEREATLVRIAQTLAAAQVL